MHLTAESPPPDIVRAKVMVPQPPAVPRGEGGAAPHRHLHEQSWAELPRAASPELTPPETAAPPAEEAPPSPSLDDSLALGGEPRSVALHALGSWLDAQQRATAASLRRVAEAHADAHSATTAESHTLRDELHSLHDLQLEHARIALSEASKRQGEASAFERQLASVTARLAEVDEQMVYVKDMLYSVLASGQGAGTIKAPSSKKLKLNPIRDRSRPSTVNPSFVRFDPVAP